MGIEIVGMSRDLAPSQAEFKKKTGAENHFLSDPDLEITKRYGAVRADLAVPLSNRYYFLIDEEGTLIWKNVTGQLIPVEALIEQLREVVKSF